MEKIQKDDGKEKIINFIKKNSFYAVLLYNVIWGTLFGIIIYNGKNSSSSCDEINKWTIICFSFCIICPFKAFFLNLIEKICEINTLYAQLVSLISSCSISIVFVTGISIQKNDNILNESCLNCAKFQFGFLICECLYIVYFFAIFIFLLCDKTKENYHGDGMISVKTIE